MKKNNGFIAGTLVHTDKGLVPIQNLNFGDRVLSKPENDESEKAYKRVVKTFKSEIKQSIMSPVNDIFCTDSHPFWVKDKGWIATKLLDQTTDRIYSLLHTEKLGSYDYPNYYLTEVKYYYRDLYDIGGLYLLPTAVDGVAVCLETNDFNIRSENHASLIDFNNDKQKYIVTNDSGSFLGGGGIRAYEGTLEVLNSEDFIFLDKEKNRDEIEFYSKIFFDAMNGEGVDHAFSAYVYNIEVEDFHTYFVGEQGFWIHQ